MYVSLVTLFATPSFFFYRSRDKLALTHILDQTLPIGYYPTLSDNSLDKILLDQNPYTVEWMVTPAAQAAGLDIPSIAGSNSFVCHPPISFLQLLPTNLFFFFSLFKKIDYIKITDANAHSWLGESVLTASLGLSLDKSLPGGVNPGDVVWLSRRKKIAEGGWTHLGRLRVQLMETLVAKGIVFFLFYARFLFSNCVLKKNVKRFRPDDPPHPTALSLDHPIPALHPRRRGQNPPLPRPIRFHPPPIHRTDVRRSRRPESRESGQCQGTALRFGVGWAGDWGRECEDT